jgi:hypothetical protein
VRVRVRVRVRGILKFIRERFTKTGIQKPGKFYGMAEFRVW